MKITIEDDTILTAIETKIAGLNDDTELMLKIQEAFYHQMSPYIPWREGILERHVNITPHYVHFLSEYAHYMYEGIVYGYPNIPIIENGVVVGWKSLTDRKKEPTGEMINYNLEQHNRATHHWDKAMMQDEGDEFVAQVGDIISDHLRRSSKNG